jgi:5-methylcytosine-specific restriction enzyme subunit McrC
VVTYDGTTAHYRPAVELARLILGSFSIELGIGGSTSSAFLVNMNDFFQDFVTAALREEFGLSSKSFPRSASGRHLHLDLDARVRLEPDLSWWAGDRCVFVGDVKYKDLAAGNRMPISINCSPI